MHMWNIRFTLGQRCSGLQRLNVSQFREKVRHVSAKIDKENKNLGATLVGPMGEKYETFLESQKLGLTLHRTQWNEAPFISKVRLWVSLSSFSRYLYSVCTFILRNLLGEKVRTL